MSHRNDYLNVQKQRIESGEEVLVNNLTDFDTIQNFVNKALITESDLQKSTNQTIQEVEKVVEGNTETAIDLQTNYKHIRDTLNEILQVTKLVLERPARQAPDQNDQESYPDESSVLPPSELAFDEDQNQSLEGENEREKTNPHSGKRGGGFSKPFRSNRGNNRGKRGSFRGQRRGTGEFQRQPNAQQQ